MKIKVIDEIKIKSVDLRKLRKKANLSLKELQKRTGIPFTYLSTLERGGVQIVQNPTWEKLKKAYDNA